MEVRAVGANVEREENVDAARARFPYRGLSIGCVAKSGRWMRGRRANTSGPTQKCLPSLWRACLD